MHAFVHCMCQRTTLEFDGEVMLADSTWHSFNLCFTAPVMRAGSFAVNHTKED